MKIYVICLSILFNIFIFNNLSNANNIVVVGSSTLYPFTTVIAENFHNKNNHFLTPIVEATGTGNGIKLFCSPESNNSPDIVNASRKIKNTEKEICEKNGINNILEIPIGYDALAIIHPKSLKNINLSIEELFLATAFYVPDSKGNLISNPYKKWSEINPKLPNIDIKIIGPSPSSGTRDSFVELVLLRACETFIKQKKLIKSDTTLKQCSIIRSDLAWIDGGENYILSIKKVNNSIDTFAILGYSFYQQNSKLVSAVNVNYISPNSQTFSNKSYPLFRPLYIYVNANHLSSIEGLKEFVSEIISKNAIGEKGYLIKRGLIPLSKKEYSDMINKINI